MNEIINSSCSAASTLPRWLKVMGHQPTTNSVGLHQKPTTTSSSTRHEKLVNLINSITTRNGIHSFIYYFDSLAPRPATATQGLQQPLTTGSAPGLPVVNDGGATKRRKAFPFHCLETRTETSSPSDFLPVHHLWVSLCAPLLNKHEGGNCLEMKCAAIS